MLATLIDLEECSQDSEDTELSNQAHQCIITIILPLSGDLLSTNSQVSHAQLDPDVHVEKITRD